MKRVICGVLVCIMCLFSGCSHLIDELFSARYPEEELYVYGGFDASYYEYSEKVLLHLSLGDSGIADDLSVRTTNEENWSYNRKTVLEGEFDEAAWNNFVIYIRMDNSYYSFDIKNYDVEKDKKNPSKYLKKYNKEEFIKKYPNYNDWEWYNS